MSDSVFASHLYTAEDLRNAPFLDDLIAMLNHAFTETHLAYFPRSALRYSTRLQLVAELKSTGFLFVTFDAANNNVPVAAAGVKPWDPTTFPYENTISDEELRALAPRHNEDAWEVTAVAVSQQWPQYKKTGLVSKLLARIYDEARNRSREGRRTRMFIRTIKEVNGVYWAAKGYNPVFEDTLPKGTYGNSEPLTQITMDKWL